MQAIWLSLLVTLTSAQCPFLCDCEGSRATCNGIASLTNFPLPDDIRHISINAANLPVVAAGKFSKHTETIEVLNSNIRHIQPAAFENLHNLTLLHFESTIIEAILPCAFNALVGSIDIVFRNCDITDVRGGGFSDISTLGNFTVFSSMLKHLQPFAFTHVQSASLKILDSHITQVDTAAFHQLHDIEEVILFRTSVDILSPGAFYAPGALENVLIDKCNFDSVSHKTLMELREATPGDHRGFRLEQSHLVCDCRSAPLLEYLQRLDEKMFTQWSICVPGYFQVADTTPEMICPNYTRGNYCTHIQLTPPGCFLPEEQRSVQIEHVDVTMCPTALPSPKGKGNSRQSELEDNGARNGKTSLLMLGYPVFYGFLILIGFYF